MGKLQDLIIQNSYNRVKVSIIEDAASSILEDMKTEDFGMDDYEIEEGFVRFFFTQDAMDMSTGAELDAMARDAFEDRFNDWYQRQWRSEHEA